MKVDILGVSFDNISCIEALDRLLKFLNTEDNHLLITPNPEIVMRAQEDNELMEILHKADLVIPDGVGIVIVSKMLKRRVKERVTGFDLIENLFNVIKDTDKTVYMFGADPGVAEKAKLNIEKKFKNLKVVGTHDGYFDEVEEEKIIKEIQSLRPDVLLVGLGCPKQEKWIYKNKHQLPVNISAAVGGIFDVMAGNLKRAPRIFQVLGLEWLHRLFLEPKRIVRMKQLPLFLIRVFKTR